MTPPVENDRRSDEPDKPGYGEAARVTPRTKPEDEIARWIARHSDDGGDEIFFEHARQEIEHELDEQRPGLDPALRIRLTISSLEKIEEGRHVKMVPDGDEDTPGIAFELTEAGRDLVRQAALRATRWRDPAPTMPYLGRLPTACRPLRAARRVRRHLARSTRASPGSDDSDPEPDPERPLQGLRASRSKPVSPGVAA